MDWRETREKLLAFDLARLTPAGWIVTLLSLLAGACIAKLGVVRTLWNRGILQDQIFLAFLALFFGVFFLLKLFLGRIGISLIRAKNGDSRPDRTS